MPVDHERRSRQRPRASLSRRGGDRRYHNEPPARAETSVERYKRRRAGGGGGRSSRRTGRSSSTDSERSIRRRRDYEGSGGGGARRRRRRSSSRSEDSDLSGRSGHGRSSRRTKSRRELPPHGGEAGSNSSAVPTPAPAGVNNNPNSDLTSINASMPPMTSAMVGMGHLGGVGSGMIFPGSVGHPPGVAAAAGGGHFGPPPRFAMPPPQAMGPPLPPQPPPQIGMPPGGAAAGPAMIYSGIMHPPPPPPQAMGLPPPPGAMMPPASIPIPLSPEQAALDEAETELKQFLDLELGRKLRRQQYYSLSASKLIFPLLPPALRHLVESTVTQASAAGGGGGSNAAAAVAQSAAKSATTHQHSSKRPSTAPAACRASDEALARIIEATQKIAIDSPSYIAAGAATDTGATVIAADKPAEDVVDESITQPPVLHTDKNSTASTLFCPFNAVNGLPYSLVANTFQWLAPPNCAYKNSVSLDSSDSRATTSFDPNVILSPLVNESPSEFMQNPLLTNLSGEDDDIAAPTAEASITTMFESSPTITPNAYKRHAARVQQLVAACRASSSLSSWVNTQPLRTHYHTLSGGGTAAFRAYVDPVAVAAVPALPIPGFALIGDCTADALAAAARRKRDGENDDDGAWGAFFESGGCKCFEEVPAVLSPVPSILRWRSITDNETDTGVETKTGLQFSKLAVVLPGSHSFRCVQLALDVTLGDSIRVFERSERLTDLSLAFERLLKLAAPPLKEIT